MKDGLIDIIKSRGWWRFHFQPLVDQTKLETLGACKQIVEKNNVQLRGWDYPHISDNRENESGYGPAGDHYECWTDWADYLEFWHMYKSGQFLHYRAVTEDWYERSLWGQSFQSIKPFTVLSVTGSVVYLMTEVYEFLARLTQDGLYDEGVRVSIRLNKTKDRRLWVGDFNRIPFVNRYVSLSDIVTHEAVLNKGEILASPHELSMKAVLGILDQFAWHKPSLDVLKRDQDNLLNRRL